MSGGVAGPVEELLRPPPGADGALATSASVMPCIWLPTIGRPGLTSVDQRSAIVPLLISTRRDLDDVRERHVHARRLDVDHDEVAAGLERLDEREHRLGAGIEVAELLGLADGLAELVLEVDERLEGLVAEQDRLGHHGLGQDLRAGLDHHDRVAGPGDDQVELRVLELAVRRVDDELATDPADAHRGDRAHGTGSR